MNLLEAMAVVSAAREEGRQAALEGQRRETNPYAPPEDELRAAGWDDGYSRAVDDMKRRQEGTGA